MVISQSGHSIPSEVVDCDGDAVVSCCVGESGRREVELLPSVVLETLLQSGQSGQSITSEVADGEGDVVVSCTVGESGRREVTVLLEVVLAETSSQSGQNMSVEVVGSSKVLLLEVSVVSSEVLLLEVSVVSSEVLLDLVLEKSQSGQTMSAEVVASGVSEVTVTGTGAKEVADLLVEMIWVTFS